MTDTPYDVSGYREAIEHLARWLMRDLDPPPPTSLAKAALQEIIASIEYAIQDEIADLSERVDEYERYLADPANDPRNDPWNQE